MQWRQLRLVCCLSVLAVGCWAQDLVASLDYGTFKGAYSKTYNISYWRRIPFAAPPVGQNRFRGPQPPLPITNGTYDSNRAFDMCPQRTVNGSEDCLYLGLYSRPWTQGQPLRPVVLFFYGGGFIQGSASFSPPPSAYPVLNISASSDLLFIYPNYRTNAFGFLPGREIAADPTSDLNPGLLDQAAAIRWASQHAQAFGGDPRNISIWGQSAGAGSVVAQVIASQPPLFQKALASSPYWPRTYRFDAPEAQWLYDALANRTGCGGPDSLACLKRVDVRKIREASLALAASHTYTTSSYTWAPVIDGRFLTRSLVEAVGGKKVNIEVGFGVFNTHEGENFIPPGLQGSGNSGSPPFNSSAASFSSWLRGFLPDFSDRDREELLKIYPPSGSTETITSYSDTYTRAGLIYRDLVLACPAYWMADAAPRGGWLAEYSISPAKHASDTYWWNTVNSAQHTDPFHYNGYTGAFASFLVTGDPNAQKLTNSSVPGVPSLKTGQEFNINAAGFSNLKLSQFRERCDFWKTVAPKVPI